MDILNRLAAGVSDISNCGWMNAWMWKDQLPWKSALSADAVLVWRTLLAHAPLSQWSDALFDPQERIMPGESSVFYVSETSDLAPKKLLLVQKSLEINRKKLIDDLVSIKHIPPWHTGVK